MIKDITIVCRSISTWMIIVTVTLSVLVAKDKSGDKKFYRLGPHDDFILMGFTINTGLKYFVVVMYSMFNTVVRTIQHEVLSPWLVNNVQDLEREQSLSVRKYAYEVTTVNTLYQWVDWLLYMNILLSQIDMVLVEVAMNLVATNITTYMYIKHNNHSKIKADINEEIPLTNKKQDA